MADLALSIGISSQEALNGARAVRGALDDIAEAYKRVQAAAKEAASQTSGALKIKVDSATQNGDDINQAMSKRQSLVKRWQQLLLKEQADGIRAEWSAKEREYKISQDWEASLITEGFRKKEKAMMAELALAEKWQADIIRAEWAAKEREYKQAQDWEAALILEGFAKKEAAIAQKAKAAAAWEASLIQEEWNARERKIKQAQDWEAALILEGWNKRQSAETAKAKEAANWEAMLIQEQWSAKERQIKIAQDWEARLIMEQFDAPGIAIKKNAQAVAQLTGMYAPLHAELQRLAADEARIRELRASGAIDANVYATALGTIHTRQQFVNTEMERMANGAKLNAYQMRNLSYQINDVVSGLMMGQPLFMIFTQQAGQFVQIFQEAGISIGRTAFAIGAVAGTIAAATAAAIMHASSVREVTSAYALQGGRIGMTRSELEQYANSVESAGNISVREARAMSAAMMNAGQVTGAAMRSSIDVARKYADALTEGDIDKAGQAMAKAMLDPAKAAKDLDGQLNFLTDTQLHQITVLTSRNEKEAAYAILMDNLKPRLEDHANTVSRIGYAWNYTANEISRYWDLLGKQFGGKKTAKEELDDANKALNVFGGVFANSIDRARVAAAQLRIELEAAQAASNATQAEWKIDTKKGGEIGRQLTPGFSEKEKLEEQSALLKKSIAQLRTYMSGPEDVKSLALQEKALDGVNRALKEYGAGLGTEGGRSLAMARVRMDAANMDAAVAQRYIAGEQARINLAGRATSDRERSLQISAAQLTVDAQQAAATTALIKNTEAEIVALEKRNAAIGQGYEAEKDAERFIAVYQQRRLDKTMSDQRTLELYSDLGKKHEQERANQNKRYLDNLNDETQYENRLADARLRGADALREESIQVEIARQRKAGNYGTEDAIRASYAAKERQDNLALAKQANPALVYRDQIEAIDRLRASQEGASVSSQQYADMEVDAKIRMLDANKDWESGVDRALMKLKRSSQDYATTAENAITSAVDGMTNAFTDFAMGTKTAGEAFQSFALGVVNNLIKIQMQALAAEAIMPGLKALGSGIFGMFSGGGEAAGASAVGDFSTSSATAFAANGGVFSGARGLSAYSGSVVSSPTIFPFASGVGLMGEAGPEAILPLKRSSDGKLGVRAANSNYASGGGVVVNVIDQRTGGAGEAGGGIQTRDGGTGPDGRKIIEVIVTDIIDKKMKNGDMDRTMRSSYGMNRVTVKR